LFGTTKKEGVFSDLVDGIVDFKPSAAHAQNFAMFRLSPFPGSGRRPAFKHILSTLQLKMAICGTNTHKNFVHRTAITAKIQIEFY